jgi:amino acid adenylation domain-containing protein
MSPSSQRIADLSSNERRALLGQLLEQKASEAKSFYPLSHNQQGIWFLCQLAPQSTIYNVNFAALISSDVNIPALRRAFQSLVARHPSLRTTFAVRSGKPVQRVHEHSEVHFEETDASTWGAEELQTRLIEEAQRLFDLERGPLLRVSLFTRSAQEHILLLVVHHIVIDFWSLAVILNELGVLYPAEKAGVRAALDPLDLQYTDYVRWQTEMLASPEGERLWAYWKKQLAGQLPVLNLPTDRPRPPVLTYRGASHAFHLSDGLAEGLKALAKAEGTTLYTVLLAAFDVMLYCHSGQEDILVASPVVGRSRAEFDGIVGFFTNPVVLRTNLSGDPTVQTFIADVRQTVLAALEHQDFPTLLLVKQLRPARDLSRAPLCQVMFVLDKPHRLAEQSVSTFVMGETGLRMNPGGLVLESFPLENRSATLDLAMMIMETAASLSVSIRYNTDLFDPATVARMAGHFETVLSQFVAQPDAKLSALKENLAEADGRQATILSDAERRQLLVEWNDTQTDFPREKCIHQLFEEQVERTPDNVAVVFEERQLTYAQLNARANQLAHHLQALGVGPEAPVAICMERSLEMVVGLLGVLKGGGAYVPLDPAYPKERLAFMLEDTQARVLLTQQRLMAELIEDRGSKIEDGDSRSSILNSRIHVVCLDADWKVIARESEKNPLTAATADNLAYIIYTSGSTGKPKGVMTQHRSLVNHTAAAGIDYDLQPAADHVLQFASISFDASAEEIYPCLTRGATLVLRSEEMPDSVSLFTRAAQNWPITVLNLPTAYWHQIAPRLSREVLTLLPSLRLVILGGERALPERITAWRQQVGQRVRLFNTYGPTEATIVATTWELSEPPEGCAALSDVPIGRAIANVQAYVLDRRLRPVAIGVAGELHIGGAGVARGYLNSPELTAERFIPDPFGSEPGARLYKTGDLVRYRPDGNLLFLGRLDDQTKVRGFRVEPGEIEAAINQHAAVRENVVVARENGQGSHHLVAYVVAAHEPAPTVSELRGFLEEKLPEHMVPSAFVLLDALPLTPHGKVDRRALPAPDGTRPELNKPFVAPRTPTEKLLAEIWAQVLGVEPIGVQDNFFDLGGHSLLATQIMFRLRDTFQAEIPLRTLFEKPTIEELALAVEEILLEEIEGLSEDEAESLADREAS